MVTPIDYFSASAPHLYCTCARGMRSMSTCFFLETFRAAFLETAWSP